MDLFGEVQVKKDYINYQRMAEPKAGVFFVDFINNTITKRYNRKKQNFSKNYSTLIWHLNNFSEENDCELFTNSINEEFLDDFIYYLESKMLRRSYIKSLLSLIKAMCRKAANYGYAVDHTYDNVELEDEETSSVYLSSNDIARIYYYNGLTKKQERIRDLFIIGCLTALRYSDLSTLTKENFGDRFITKVTKKTGVKVVIPIHDFVKEIYNKYDGNFCPILTSQHFNRYIKLICRKIGLTEPVTINYNKGGNTVYETKEKWQLLSSHTARRSGATNLYNTGRLKIRDIMSITGHTSEKSFMRYIRNTKEEIANSIAGDFYFKK